MANTDLIACLYPILNNRHGRFSLENNPNRFNPGREASEEPSPGVDAQHGRILTRPPSPVERSGDDQLECIELRFSNGPKTNRGFVFGRDNKCDIVLPELKGISSYHFTLAFEDGFEDTDKYRLVLRDVSTFGTIVEYTGLGGELRRGFRWILSGHNIASNSTIVIKVHNLLHFRIVVHIPHITQALVDSVTHFLRDRSPDSLFADLNLYNPPRTEAATGAHSPTSGPILINMRELGSGAFAVATHCWDVSTGRQMARKQPLQRLSEKERRAWRREAQLLAKLSHEHIVRLYALIEGPTLLHGIELHLECVFGGTLNHRFPLPYIDCLEVARQCLAALAYLHGQSPPIVHRDIKPQNILVQDGLEGICIKLADFGFSREDQNMMTICGTHRYCAPEMWLEKTWRDNGGSSRAYSPAVDIWSLGVMVLEGLSGLPRSSDRDANMEWCKKVVKHLHTQAIGAPPNHLHHLLMSHMVVMDPKARGSAQQCYDQIVRLAMALQPSQTLSQEENRQSALKRTPPRLRPLPCAGGHEILPTIESDDEDDEDGGSDEDDEPTTALATGPNVPAPPLPPMNTAGQPSASSAVSPTASRKRMSRHGSSSSSSGKTTPKRIARSSQFGRQHTGHGTLRASRWSFRHDLVPEASIPEEGAESGYFAANPLLDPLVVGSEVAMLGREIESVGTNQPGSPRSIAPQVRGPQQTNPPQGDGDESSVVLGGSWLYKP